MITNVLQFGISLSVKVASNLTTARRTTDKRSYPRDLPRLPPLRIRHRRAPSCHHRRRIPNHWPWRSPPFAPLPPPLPLSRRPIHRRRPPRRRRPHGAHSRFPEERVQGQLVRELHQVPLLRALRTL